MNVRECMKYTPIVLRGSIFHIFFPPPPKINWYFYAVYESSRLSRSAKKEGMLSRQSRLLRNNHKLNVRVSKSFYISDWTQDEWPAFNFSTYELPLTVELGPKETLVKGATTDAIRVIFLHQTYIHHRNTGVHW
jgi:hypothetical protein